MLTFSLARPYNSLSILEVLVSTSFSQVSEKCMQKFIQEHIDYFEFFFNLMPNLVLILCFESRVAFIILLFFIKRPMSAMLLVSLPSS